MTSKAASTVETATVAEQGAPVASKKAFLKKGASKKQSAPHAKKVASKKGASKKAVNPAAKKEAKLESKKAAKPKDSQPPEGSKKQIVIEMMRCNDGATLAEIMAKTDWQAHTVRGFVSGTLMKKMKLPVSSTKNEAGERVYKIEK